MSNMNALMKEWIENLPSSPSGKLRMVPLTEQQLAAEDSSKICLEIERSSEEEDL